MPTFIETAQALEVALKALQMYTAQHPRTVASLEAVKASLVDWIADKASLHLAVAGDKVFANGVKVEGSSPHLKALARRFSDRMIAGFIIQKDLDDADLLAMLNLLLLKPAKIEELGGPGPILEREGITRIRVSITRYKEVGEGGESEGDDETGPGFNEDASKEAIKESKEEAGQETGGEYGFEGGENSSSGEGMSLEEAEALELSMLLGPPEQLMGIVRDALGEILGAMAAGEGLALATLQPAYLGNLGAMGYQLGLGDGMPSPTQLSVLRQVLLSLPPESQLSLIAGMATLPGQPEGLALGIKELAPEILSVATTTLLEQGHSWNHLQGPLQDVLRPLPEREAMIRALAIHMRNLGYDGNLAESLLRRLDWEGLTLEAKVLKALEGQQLWALTLEQRLAFLRELLDQERSEAFQRVLDRVLETLTVEDQALRLAATQTLAGVSHWMRDPGLPLGSEGPLTQKLEAHFAVESSAPIHQAATEALSAILGALVLRGELGSAHACMMELQDLCGIHEEIQDWRQEGLDRLKLRLVRADCVDRILQALFEVDKDQMGTEILPFLEWLGPSAAVFLMEKLGEETERQRRGRLIEALRVLGPAATGTVQEALSSDTWYLVRNALNLLSDVGDADALPDVIPLLRHTDGRVRRAAVRAMWKLGGPASEPHLLGILKETDPETKFEVLFGLGQVKMASSAPQVLELAEDHRFHERLRLKALETLGDIGAPSAIPALAELLKKKKTFFGTSSEPFDIRMGAAKALQGIGTPEARWALQKVVEAESKGPERDALQRILEAFARK
ncbi:MAG: HEAT repeat domain-containing protein [Acidobacteriota bacterium]|nr:HEAT repeat domain-containing protein [Acidobacteriota bacterium]